MLPSSQLSWAFGHYGVVKASQKSSSGLDIASPQFLQLKSAKEYSRKSGISVRNLRFRMLECLGFTKTRADDKRPPMDAFERAADFRSTNQGPRGLDAILTFIW